MLDEYSGRCGLILEVQSVLANSSKERGCLWLMTGVIPMSDSRLTSFQPTCWDRAGTLRISQVS
jgi:hypothetical protein